MEDRQGKDNYVVLHPKAESDATKHKYSLIWLHGLGDSAYGFLDVFTDKVINIVPPSCKVILATAPEREVTCNNGLVMTSWFDIKSLDRTAMTIEDNYKNVSQVELRESTAIVTKLIDEEAAALGSSENVFVGGFSQGCAVSLASFLTYKAALGGVVGLSGMHALDLDWAKEVDVPLKKQTKVFLYHGKSDPLIPAAFA